MSQSIDLLDLMLGRVTSVTLTRGGLSVHLRREFLGTRPVLWVGSRPPKTTRCCPCVSPGTLGSPLVDWSESPSLHRSSQCLLVILNRSIPCKVRPLVVLFSYLHRDGHGSRFYSPTDDVPGISFYYPLCKPVLHPRHCFLKLRSNSLDLQFCCNRR